jgi:hypothetical protein
VHHARRVIHRRRAVGSSARLRGRDRKANEALRAQRRIERVYRDAMASLVGVEDLREVMSRRELYRRVPRIGEVVVDVAERVWYAVVKEA